VLLKDQRSARPKRSLAVGSKRDGAVPQQEPDFKLLGQLAVLSQVGLEMAAPVGLGAALDYYFGWAPWASVCGALRGLVGGMTHLIAILNRRAAEDSAKQKRDLK